MRLSAVKIPNNQANSAGFKDDATADELRAAIMHHIAVLTDAGVLDLEALLTSKRRMAN
jgi:hypothetical protein